MKLSLSTGFNSAQRLNLTERPAQIKVICIYCSTKRIIREDYIRPVLCMSWAKRQSGECRAKLERRNPSSLRRKVVHYGRLVLSFIAAFTPKLRSPVTSLTRAEVLSCLINIFLLPAVNPFASLRYARRPHVFKFQVNHNQGYQLREGLNEPHVKSIP